MKMAPAELDVIEKSCRYVREEGRLEREVFERARAAERGGRVGMEAELGNTIIAPESSKRPVHSARPS